MDYLPYASERPWHRKKNAIYAPDKLGHLGVTTTQADAIHIVRCVNSHEELMTFLRRYVDVQRPIQYDAVFHCTACSCDPEPQVKDMDHDEDCVYDEAWQLLAKLEGE